MTAGGDGRVGSAAGIYTRKRLARKPGNRRTKRSALRQTRDSGSDPPFRHLVRISVSYRISNDLEHAGEPIVGS
jgi:hypothetical protein